MTEHFYFRSHLCIAMELLSINLYELIKANGFVGFTTNLIRRFTSQMLASLALMRQHRIVHCDLKPEVREIGLCNRRPESHLSVRMFSFVILLKVASKSLTLGAAALNTRKVFSLFRRRLQLLTINH